MNIFPNKRKSQPLNRADLFKEKNLNQLLKNEQRKSEIKKIKEVKAQDKTYYYTLGACVFMIIVLICLALFGGYQ